MDNIFPFPTEKTFEKPEPITQQEVFGFPKGNQPEIPANESFTHFKPAPFIAPSTSDTTPKSEEGFSFSATEQVWRNLGFQYFAQWVIDLLRKAAANDK